ncbi:guanylin-like [Scleropages formosus]|uniref:Guanylate cyclase activator 2B n=1 Tax=Scleropages formosus TaxID=113540 RepID=A0A8C9R4V8_SCLFO|nr:guanylin-like [Scleropages formosus]
MKTFLFFALLLTVYCLVAQAVQVKEGDFTFSLESVKKLKNLMDVRVVKDSNPRLASTSTAALCANPALPEEFKPVCQSKSAALSFYRLGSVAYNSDVCEICAFAACTGC